MENRHPQLQPKDCENSVPLKAWTRGILLEEAARQPLLEVEQLPLITKGWRPCRMARGEWGAPWAGCFGRGIKIPDPDDFAVLLFCGGDDLRECTPAETGRPVRGLHPFPANRVRSWFHLFSLSAGSHQSPIPEISTLARSFLPWVRESPIGAFLPLPWNVSTGAYAPRAPITKGGRMDSAESQGTRRRPRP